MAACMWRPENNKNHFFFLPWGVFRQSTKYLYQLINLTSPRFVILTFHLWSLLINEKMDQI